MSAAAPAASTDTKTGGSTAGATTKSVPILGYWKIRGLAQPIRNVLEYAGEPYEDKLYEQGDAPHYSRESWTTVKPNLGLDFPNLPYLIDGPLKLTQSDAILNYVGRKAGLCGKNLEESAVVDMVLGQAYDVRSALTSMCYSQRFNDLKASHFKNTFPGQAAELEAFLCKGNKEWFAGSLSIADFVLYETFDLARTIEPTSLDATPAIQAFLQRFELLPALTKYFKSNRYSQRPFNNKSAVFK